MNVASGREALEFDVVVLEEAEGGTERSASVEIDSGDEISRIGRSTVDGRGGSGGVGGSSGTVLDDGTGSSRLQKSLQNSRDFVSISGVADHSCVVLSDERLEPFGPDVSLYGDVEFERSENEDLESVDISQRDPGYGSESLVPVGVVLQRLRAGMRSARHENEDTKKTNLVGEHESTEDELERGGLDRADGSTLGSGCGSRRDHRRSGERRNVVQSEDDIFGRDEGGREDLRDELTESGTRFGGEGGRRFLVERIEFLSVNANRLDRRLKSGVRSQRQSVSRRVLRSSHSRRNRRARRRARRTRVFAVRTDGSLRASSFADRTVVELWRARSRGGTGGVNVVEGAGRGGSSTSSKHLVCFVRPGLRLSNGGGRRGGGGDAGGPDHFRGEIGERDGGSFDGRRRRDGAGVGDELVLDSGSGDRFDGRGDDADAGAVRRSAERGMIVIDCDDARSSGVSHGRLDESTTLLTKEDRGILSRDSSIVSNPLLLHRHSSTRSVPATSTVRSRPRADLSSTEFSVSLISVRSSSVRQLLLRLVDSVRRRSGRSRVSLRGEAVLRLREGDGRGLSGVGTVGVGGVERLGRRSVAVEGGVGGRSHRGGPLLSVPGGIEVVHIVTVKRRHELSCVHASWGESETKIDERPSTELVSRPALTRGRFWLPTKKSCRGRARVGRGLKFVGVTCGVVEG